MRNFILIATVAVAVAGCSSTAGDLMTKSSTQTTVRAYAENYQEIYRRVQTNATRCLASQMNATAALEVDAELYNELGFAEVTVSLSNFGTRNYYASAKIEKAANGSQMTVHSGNTINNRAYIDKMTAWADGSEAC